jgi:hypothetical protein
MPPFPLLLSKALIVPLIKKGSLQLKDLAWFNEEEKDELFDLRGQYQVAAAVLDNLAKDG